MTNTRSNAQKNSNTDNASAFEDWATVQEFQNRFPDLPATTLNRYLDDRRKNGLHQHVKNIRKNLHINVPDFRIWFTEKMSKFLKVIEEISLRERGKNRLTAVSQ